MLHGDFKTEKLPREGTTEAGMDKIRIDVENNNILPFGSDRGASMANQQQQQQQQQPNSSSLPSSSKAASSLYHIFATPSTPPQIKFHQIPNKVNSTNFLDKATPLCTGTAATTTTAGSEIGLTLRMPLPPYYTEQNINASDTTDAKSFQKHQEAPPAATSCANLSSVHPLALETAVKATEGNENEKVKVKVFQKDGRKQGDEDEDEEESTKEGEEGAVVEITSPVVATTAEQEQPHPIVASPSVAHGGVLVVAAPSLKLKTPLLMKQALKNDMTIMPSPSKQENIMGTRGRAIMERGGNNNFGFPVDHHHRQFDYNTLSSMEAAPDAFGTATSENSQLLNNNNNNNNSNNDTAFNFNCDGNTNKNTNVIQTSPHHHAYMNNNNNNNIIHHPMYRGDPVTDATKASPAAIYANFFGNGGHNMLTMAKTTTTKSNVDTTDNNNTVVHHHPPLLPTTTHPSNTDSQQPNLNQQHFYIYPQQTDTTYYPSYYPHHAGGAAPMLGSPATALPHSPLQLVYPQHYPNFYGVGVAGGGGGTANLLPPAAAAAAAYYSNNHRNNYEFTAATNTSYEENSKGAEVGHPREEEVEEDVNEEEIEWSDEEDDGEEEEGDDEGEFVEDDVDGDDSSSVSTIPSSWFQQYYAGTAEMDLNTKKKDKKSAADDDNSNKGEENDKANDSVRDDRKNSHGNNKTQQQQAGAKKEKRRVAKRRKAKKTNNALLPPVVSSNGFASPYNHEHGTMAFYEDPNQQGGPPLQPPMQWMGHQQQQQQQHFQYYTPHYNHYNYHNYPPTDNNNNNNNILHTSSLPPPHLAAPPATNAGAAQTAINDPQQIHQYQQMMMISQWYQQQQQQTQQGYGPLMTPEQQQQQQQQQFFLPQQQQQLNAQHYNLVQQQQQQQRQQQQHVPFSVEQQPAVPSLVLLDGDGMHNQNGRTEIGIGVLPSFVVNATDPTAADDRHNIAGAEGPKEVRLGVNTTAVQQLEQNCGNVGGDEGGGPFGGTCSNASNHTTATTTNTNATTAMDNILYQNEGARGVLGTTPSLQHHNPVGGSGGGLTFATTTPIRLMGMIGPMTPRSLLFTQKEEGGQKAVNDNSSDINNNNNNNNNNEPSGGGGGGQRGEPVAVGTDIDTALPQVLAGQRTPSYTHGGNLPPKNDNNNDDSIFSINNNNGNGRSTSYFGGGSSNRVNNEREIDTLFSFGLLGHEGDAGRGKNNVGSTGPALGNNVDRRSFSGEGGAFGGEERKGISIVATITPPSAVATPPTAAAAGVISRDPIPNPGSSAAPRDNENYGYKYGNFSAEGEEEEVTPRPETIQNNNMLLYRMPPVASSSAAEKNNTDEKWENNYKKNGDEEDNDFSFLSEYSFCDRLSFLFFRIRYFLIGPPPFSPRVSISTLAALGVFLAVCFTTTCSVVILTLYADAFGRNVAGRTSDILATACVSRITAELSGSTDVSDALQFVVLNMDKVTLPTDDLEEKMVSSTPSTNSTTVSSPSSFSEATSSHFFKSAATAMATEPHSLLWYDKWHRYCLSFGRPTFSLISQLAFAFEDGNYAACSGYATNNSVVRCVSTRRRYNPYGNTTEDPTKFLTNSSASSLSSATAGNASGISPSDAIRRITVSYYNREDGRLVSQSKALAANEDLRKKLWYREISSYGDSYFRNNWEERPTTGTLGVDIDADAHARGSDSAATAQNLEDRVAAVASAPTSATTAAPTTAKPSLLDTPSIYSTWGFPRGLNTTNLTIVPHITSRFPMAWLKSWTSIHFSSGNNTKASLSLSFSIVNHSKYTPPMTMVSRAATPTTNSTSSSAAAGGQSPTTRPSSTYPPTIVPVEPTREPSNNNNNNGTAAYQENDDFIPVPLRAFSTNTTDTNSPIGSFIGVASFSIGLSELTDFIDALRPTGGTRVVVLDQCMKVLAYSSEAGSGSGGDLGNNPTFTSRIVPADYEITDVDKRLRCSFADSLTNNGDGNEDEIVSDYDSIISPNPTESANDSNKSNNIMMNSTVNTTVTQTRRLLCQIPVEELDMPFIRDMRRRHPSVLYQFAASAKVCDSPSSSAVIHSALGDSAFGTSTTSDSQKKSHAGGLSAQSVGTSRFILNDEAVWTSVTRAPQPMGWTIVIFVPEKDLVGPVETTRMMIIAIAIVGIAVFMVIAVFLLRLLLRPLKSIAHNMLSATYLQEDEDENGGTDDNFGDTSDDEEEEDEEELDNVSVSSSSRNSDPDCTSAEKSALLLLFDKKKDENGGPLDEQTKNTTVCGESATDAKRKSSNRSKNRSNSAFSVRREGGAEDSDNSEEMSEMLDASGTTCTTGDGNSGRGLRLTTRLGLSNIDTSLSIDGNPLSFFSSKNKETKNKDSTSKSTSGSKNEKSGVRSLSASSKDSGTHSIDTGNGNKSKREKEKLLKSRANDKNSNNKGGQKKGSGSKNGSKTSDKKSKGKKASKRNLREPSFLSDIAMLQEAYWKMVDEIRAFRGYIPEHVCNEILAAAALKSSLSSSQPSLSSPQSSTYSSNVSPSNITSGGIHQQHSGGGPTPSSVGNNGAGVMPFFKSYYHRSPAAAGGGGIKGGAEFFNSMSSAEDLHASKATLLSAKGGGSSNTNTAFGRVGSSRPPSFYSDPAIYGGLRSPTSTLYNENAEQFNSKTNKRGRKRASLAQIREAWEVSRGLSSVQRRNLDASTNSPARLVGGRRSEANDATHTPKNSRLYGRIWNSVSSLWRRNRSSSYLPSGKNGEKQSSSPQRRPEATDTKNRFGTSQATHHVGAHRQTLPNNDNNIDVPCPGALNVVTGVRRVSSIRGVSPMPSSAAAVQAAGEIVTCTSTTSPQGNTDNGSNININTARGSTPSKQYDLLLSPKSAAREERRIRKREIRHQLLRQHVENAEEPFTAGTEPNIGMKKRNPKDIFYLSAAAAVGNNNSATANNFNSINNANVKNATTAGGDDAEFMQNMLLLEAAEGGSLVLNGRAGVSCAMTDSLENNSKIIQKNHAHTMMIMRMNNLVKDDNNTTEEEESRKKRVTAGGDGKGFLTGAPNNNNNNIDIDNDNENELADPSPSAPSGATGRQGVTGGWSHPATPQNSHRNHQKQMLPASVLTNAAAADGGGGNGYVGFGLSLFTNFGDGNDNCVLQPQPDDTPMMSLNSNKRLMGHSSTNTMTHTMTAGGGTNGALTSFDADSSFFNNPPSARGPNVAPYAGWGGNTISNNRLKIGTHNTAQHNTLLTHAQIQQQQQNRVLNNHRSNLVMMVTGGAQNQKSARQALAAGIQFDNSNTSPSRSPSVFGAPSSLPPSPQSMALSNDTPTHKQAHADGGGGGVGTGTQKVSDEVGAAFAPSHQFGQAGGCSEDIGGVGPTNIPQHSMGQHNQQQLIPLGFPAASEERRISNSSIISTLDTNNNYNKTEMKNHGGACDDDAFTDISHLGRSELAQQNGIGAGGAASTTPMATREGGGREGDDKGDKYKNTGNSNDIGRPPTAPAPPTPKSSNPFIGNRQTNTSGGVRRGVVTISDPTGKNNSSSSTTKNIHSVPRHPEDFLTPASLRLLNGPPVFFSDHTLVDRDVSVVVVNIVAFHQYALVTHGADLARQHEVIVNYIHAAAARCGGVLDTFNGDKMWVSFNATSRCVRSAVAAICFAVEVSQHINTEAAEARAALRKEQQEFFKREQQEYLRKQRLMLDSHNKNNSNNNGVGADPTPSTPEALVEMGLEVMTSFGPTAAATALLMSAAALEGNSSPKNQQNDLSATSNNNNNTIIAADPQMVSAKASSSSSTKRYKPKYRAALSGVTIGVATGRAYVGPMGSKNIRRHTIISNAVTEASALERQCGRYPDCAVMIGGDMIPAVEGYCQYLIIDVCALPGSNGKRRRIASVKGLMCARDRDMRLLRGSASASYQQAMANYYHLREVRAREEREAQMKIMQHQLQSELSQKQKQKSKGPEKGTLHPAFTQTNSSTHTAIVNILEDSGANGQAGGDNSGGGGGGVATTVGAAAKRMFSLANSYSQSSASLSASSTTLPPQPSGVHVSGERSRRPFKVNPMPTPPACPFPTENPYGLTNDFFGAFLEGRVDECVRLMRRLDAEAGAAQQYWTISESRTKTLAEIEKYQKMKRKLLSLVVAAYARRDKKISKRAILAKFSSITTPVIPTNNNNNNENENTPKVSATTAATTTTTGSDTHSAGQVQKGAQMQIATGGASVTVTTTSTSSSRDSNSDPSLNLVVIRKEGGGGGVGTPAALLVPSSATTATPQSMENSARPHRHRRDTSNNNYSSSSNNANTNAELLTAQETLIRGIIVCIDAKIAALNEQLAALPQLSELLDAMKALLESFEREENRERERIQNNHNNHHPVSSRENNTRRSLCPESSLASPSVLLPPYSAEQCEHIAVMLQFVWSLLSQNPPCDGRSYRSPLGEAYARRRVD